ncbi:signal transduction histidine kinase [Amycolatopsis cihanbeyliensis]|uniref:Signal transduction histidine kinase n=2 Tax=Amycolatopsis cihanbeyliensis TaxID=1128664 RepID=A0A542DBY0_AMYCI|nr:signal transduction histidine kinase [Amycolatopsis cihanbeyliensis]
MIALVVAQLALLVATRLALRLEGTPIELTFCWLMLIIIPGVLAWWVYGGLCLAYFAYVYYVQRALHGMEPPPDILQKLVESLPFIAQYFAVGLAIRSMVNMAMLSLALLRARAEITRLGVARERSRMSQQLHDRLGHSMVAIMLRSELAERLSGVDDAKARTEMRAVNDTARETLDDVRRIAHGGLNTSFDRELYGATELLEASGIHCLLHIAGEPDGRTAEVLGWVLREATTNVLKHSTATECVITLSEADKAYALTMANDGVAQHGQERIGSVPRCITGRVEEAGGSVTVGRSRGKFTLRVEMPARPVRPSGIANDLRAARHEENA